MPLRRNRRQYEQLTDFDRGRIIGLREAGWSNRRIGRHLGRSDMVVARCWQQWITEGRVYRRGEDIQCHQEKPIRRRLTEVGLRSRRPLRRLPLTPHHRQCRLDFCRPRATWSVTDWRRVLFSDESRFSLSADDHRTRVLRRTGQRSDPGFIVEWHTAISQGQGCGGSVYAEEGHIYSPRYPQAYTSADICTWHISVPGYHTIKVEFVMFAFNSTSGCVTNFVELYDGNVGNAAERVVRYCGTDDPGTHISTTNKMIIKMSTDNHNSGAGFKLRFTSNPYVPGYSMRFLQKDSVPNSENQYDSGYIYLN
ncbi:cubilin [Trichonephila clavipes]|nr:cubilin [Trichonephila clavipes]